MTTLLVGAFVTSGGVVILGGGGGGASAPSIQFIVDQTGATDDTYLTINDAIAAAEASNPTAAQRAIIAIQGGNISGFTLTVPEIDVIGLGFVFVLGKITINFGTFGTVQLQNLNCFDVEVASTSEIVQLTVRNLISSGGFKFEPNDVGSFLRMYGCEFVAAGSTRTLELLQTLALCVIESCTFSTDGGDNTSADIRDVPMQCRNTKFVGRVLHQLGTQDVEYTECSFYSTFTDALTAGGAVAYDLQSCKFRAASGFGIEAVGGSTVKMGTHTWTGPGGVRDPNGGTFSFDADDNDHVFTPDDDDEWNPIPDRLRPAVNTIAGIVGKLYIVDQTGKSGNFTTMTGAYTKIKADIGTPTLSNQAVMRVLSGTYAFPDIDTPFIHFEGVGDVQISTNDVDVTHSLAGVVKIANINFKKMSMLTATVPSDLELINCTFTDGYENISGIDGTSLKATNCRFVATGDEGFAAIQEMFLDFESCHFERVGGSGNSAEFRKSPVQCRNSKFIGRCFQQTAVTPGPSMYFNCEFFSDTTDAFEKDNTGAVVELQYCTLDAASGFGIRSDNSGDLILGYTMLTGDGQVTDSGNDPIIFTPGIGELKYTPAVPGDYDPSVDHLREAVDQLAARPSNRRREFSTTTNTGAIGVAGLYACTSTAAERTLTISDVTTALGSPTHFWPIKIKDESYAAATNKIIIVPESGNIENGSEVEITTNGGVVNLYSDGTDWHGG